MTFGKILEEFKSRLQNSNEDKELYLIDKKSGKELDTLTSDSPQSVVVTKVAEQVAIEIAAQVSLPRSLLAFCLSPDQILEDRYHVRDVYTYRKGFSSPLLLLEFLDEEPAFNKRQAQVTQYALFPFKGVSHQAPVIQTIDSAIRRINHSPVEKS